MKKIKKIYNDFQNLDCFKDKPYVISVFFIILLIYIPAFHIPFHSDDYHYFLQGLSIENRWHHYVNWSGRLITDFTSSYMLNLFPKFIYMAINSLVLLITIICISKIPYIVTKTEHSKNSFLSLWLIFFVYWVANPNLGQTTFWLVGSANYLWPLMWASIYFVYILSLLSNNQKLNIKKISILFILGFFAGLSNEGIGISVVLFSIILFFLYKNQKYIVLNGLLGTIIGFLILYLSPGNSKRLSHNAFSNWVNSSTFNKIDLHIYERLPNVLSNYWFAMTIIIFLFCIINILYKDKKIDIRYYIFSFIFFLLSLFSVFIFIKSPIMPLRSQNTGLFFLIIAISFLINAMISLKNMKSFFISIILILSCSFYFVPSYIYFTYAIIQTSSQEKIRENIIKDAKNKGKNEVKIPDWYFTRLLKKTDKFDMYRSGAMAPYYGVKKIIWMPVKFNYSVLKNTKPIKINMNLKNSLKLKSIFYSNGYKIFDKNRIILEFNNSLLNYIKKGDNILFIHLYLKNNDSFINKDQDINNFTQIGESFYYCIDLNNIKLDNIEFIKFGFYNNKTKTNSNSFSLNFKEKYDIFLNDKN